LNRRKQREQRSNAPLPLFPSVQNSIGVENVHFQAEHETRATRFGATRQPNDAITLTVERAGETMELEVKLKRRGDTTRTP
jgi:hypothetical protein